MLSVAQGQDWDGVGGFVTHEAAVPGAPVTLHRLHQGQPKGCTVQLQYDAEDDSISNDPLHASLLCFCGAFLFFWYFLFNPLSQGMQR